MSLLISGGVATAPAVTLAGTMTRLANVLTNVVFCYLRHVAFEASGPCGPSDSGLVSMWRPKDRAYYKENLEPTVEEVKKPCTTCRHSVKTKRVLFHYNDHGVPKPTPNGEIWVFNKSYTHYIPLQITDLDSWLKTPSIYVFDCSATGLAVNSFVELNNEWNAASSNGQTKDCILLSACETHKTLPHSAEFTTAVFTSCLTTPIKVALRWFCTRSLLRELLDYSLIDKILGCPNDRKTLLRKLDWIFTAVTDTIAWNALPHDLFQQLFRQDLLVASLFSTCGENYAISELLAHFFSNAATDPLTSHVGCLGYGCRNLPPLVENPTIAFRVLLSQCLRLRAFVLVGRFLDMGPWTVDLALSVGIVPYVLKLLHTTTAELRQILVFIWTKLLPLDKSCLVDLVKDGGTQAASGSLITQIHIQNNVLWLILFWLLLLIVIEGVRRPLLKQGRFMSSAVFESAR